MLPAGLKGIVARLRGAPALVAKHLFGQGVIQLLNLLVGIVVLRLISVEEYALYIIAMLLAALASVSSDMGLAQAVTTLGARNHTDAPAVTAIFRAAVRYRRMLFIAVVPVVCGLAPFLTSAHQLSPLQVATIVGIVLCNAFAQQLVALRIAVLNAQHDARGLFRAGLAGAFVRLACVVLCYWWPFAVVALAVNLVGTLAAGSLLYIYSRRYLTETASADPRWRVEVKRFIIPLIPALIYYVFQGQISTFLLSMHGAVNQVAEVGALTRLGQIVGFLTPAFGFFVQPHFARINTRAEYSKKVYLAGGLWLLIGLIVIASTVWLPHWWLGIIGPKYGGLRNELPLAMAGSLFILLGGLLYTIVISRDHTRGQAWNIVIGIGIQIIFLALHEVRSTSDALILNMLPAMGYALLQAAMVYRTVRAWK